MTKRIALVTDSTCNLYPELAVERHIYVAPLYVLWGEEAYKDGVDITEKEFFRRLSTTTAIPTTSQVSPQDFIDLFEHARKTEEADEVICAVLSSDLSGTYASAIQAQTAVDFPVHVVDTRQISWALGFTLLEAANMRDAGAGVDEIVASIKATADYSRLFFTIESLEFLHRGGRIGNAARLVGTALSIKPLLEVENGIVETVDKVRTRKRAIKQLVKVIQDRSNGRGIKRLAVIHGEAQEDADELLAYANETLNPTESYNSYLTAVLAVHTGPGAVGINVEWSN